MSSLYDKYHSDHNRTYMYNLIKEMILKEYQVDTTTNATYDQFFQTNFINTFNSVNTEDIKDLNNHLLTTQLEYFQNFILKQNLLTKQDITEPETTDYLFHSLHRNINLQNSSRHNFRVDNPRKGKSWQVDKVILPIEDTPLFMCPILILCLDTKYIDLHLRGTMKLRNREYGLYTPFHETIVQLNSDKLRIQLKNQLFNLKKGCDVYKIGSYKDGKIQVTYDKGEFLETDYIRICNFEGIELDDDSCLKEQYKVETIEDNKLIIDTKDVIKEGLYIMNMSLQNTLHLSSPE